MSRYLLQIRLVKLPSPGDKPDRWSSATSTMTEAEVSVPFDSDEPPDLTTSDAYSIAVARAVGLLSRSGRADG